jgi:predicted nucleic acid-binding protein
LAKLPIEQSGRQNDARIFPIARRHGLTFYDAAYVALAQHEQLSLATLDVALARSAAAEGVSLAIPS